MIDTTVQTGTSITWQHGDYDIWRDPYNMREILNRWISDSEYDKLTMMSNEDHNVVTITEWKKKMVVENETQKIKKVIFSDPATIVLWEDGTKTVVKTQKGDAYDPEKGLAMACMRKILDKKDYHKWLEEARGKNIPINEEGRSKGV